MLAALIATHAASEPTMTPYEYATIRWGGPKNMHVVRPDGKVQFFGSQFDRIRPPEGCNENSYYMNLVLNILAKEGYETAAMTDEQIVVRRPARR